MINTYGYYVLIENIKKNNVHVRNIIKYLKYLHHLRKKEIFYFLCENYSDNIREKSVYIDSIIEVTKNICKEKKDKNDIMFDINYLYLLTKNNFPVNKLNIILTEIEHIDIKNPWKKISNFKIGYKSCICNCHRYNNSSCCATCNFDKEIIYKFRCELRSYLMARVAIMRGYINWLENTLDCKNIDNILKFYQQSPAEVANKFLLECSNRNKNLVDIACWIIECSKEYHPINKIYCYKHINQKNIVLNRVVDSTFDVNCGLEQYKKIQYECKYDNYYEYYNCVEYDDDDPFSKLIANIVVSVHHKNSEWYHYKPKRISINNYHQNDNNVIIREKICAYNFKKYNSF
jgi:hypothetical protein